MDGVTGYELNGAIYGTPRQDVEQPGLAWDSVNGGVFIAGKFTNLANFGDITIYSAGNFDAFVARIEVRKRIPFGRQKRQRARGEAFQLDNSYDPSMYPSTLIDSS